jgi:hypothetical protein
LDRGDIKDGVPEVWDSYTAKEVKDMLVDPKTAEAGMGLRQNFIMRV